MRVRSRHSGFTLVELMVVVAIVGIAGMMAARLYSRGVRGENAPSVARTMMATMMDAHHNALTLGQPVRATLDGTAKTVTMAQYVANSATPAWVPQSTLALPSTLQLCAAYAGMQLGTVSPTCPLSGTQVICFYGNGKVDIPSSGSCSTTTLSTSPSGATLYFATYAGDKKYRVVVFGLTGMVKLIDTW